MSRVDIVGLLRGDYFMQGFTSETLHRAADEIERLRFEVAKLQAALEAMEKVACVDVDVANVNADAAK